MISRRLAAGGALALAAFSLLVAWLNVFPWWRAPSFVDIEWYRKALDAVAAGRPMYEWLGYPPISLVVLSPLRGLPELAGEQLWTAGSLLLSVALAAGIVHLVNVRKESSDRASTNQLVQFGIAIAMIVFSYPMNFELVTGQISLLVMALAFVDASGLLPRRYQGILVGLAGALKLTPLAFLLYYALTRQWRPLARAGAAFAIATAVGFALFPQDSVFFWTHVDSSERLGPGAFINVSLLGALSHWIPDPVVARWLWILLAAVLGCVALVRARTHFLAGEQLQAALVVGCATTVVSPIAWPHYQFWQVLVAVWLVLSGARNGLIRGMALYAVFSFPFALLCYAGYPALWARLAWELLLVASVLICMLGLPPDRGREAASATSATSAARTATSA